jgi:hypothetical protein
MEQWFRKAGYRDVRENANISQLNKGIAAVNEANLLLENGYRVCLLISANMTDYDDQSDKGWGTSKHWVVLREKIQVMDGHVKTKVFSWGKGDYEIPHPKTGNLKPLPVGDFLQNFYGYVAAKA